MVAGGRQIQPAARRIFVHKVGCLMSLSQCCEMFMLRSGAEVTHENIQNLTCSSFSMADVLWRALGPFSQWQVYEGRSTCGASALGYCARVVATTIPHWLRRLSIAFYNSVNIHSSIIFSTASINPTSVLPLLLCIWGAEGYENRRYWQVEPFLKSQEANVIYCHKFMYWVCEDRLWSLFCQWHEERTNYRSIAESSPQEIALNPDSRAVSPVQAWKHMETFAQFVQQSGACQSCQLWLHWHSAVDHWRCPATGYIEAWEVSKFGTSRGAKRLNAMVAMEYF